MANPFANVLGAPTGGSDPMSMLMKLKSDPMSVLRGAGFSVPTNLSDPNAMLQHLLASGQISQQQINNAQRMAQRMGLR